METIDWSSILSDAGTIALIASALVVAIQFIKVLYYKLPWGWIQKTPGEVWFILSIVAGIGVAVAFNYQVLLDTGMPLLSRFGTVIYGLTIGAGSKIIHAIATTAGAKFTAIKDNATTDAAVNAAVVTTAETLPDTVVTTPVPEIVSEPIEMATPVPPEVVVVKRMKDNKVYVLIDGQKHFITGKFLELDIDNS